MPAQLLDASLHGFLLATEERIDVGYVMDIDLVLPEGSVSFLVTARYVGPTRYGPGVGVSILVATPVELQRWVAHYHALVARARRIPAGELTCPAA